MLSVITIGRRGPVALATVAVAAAVVSARVEIPRLAWQTSLQSAEHEYELRGATLAADGSAVWLAVASRARGTMGGPEKPLVTAITASGKPTGRLIDPAGDAKIGTLAPRRGVLGLMAGPDRAIVVAVNRSAGDPALAAIDTASSQPVLLRTLSFQGGTPEIARLVELGAGRRLVLGTQGNRPFVAEMASNGTLRWQRLLEEENVNLDDGSPTADGGAIVTGRKGADPTATRVWVAKLSAKGEIERQAAFDGWLGAIAQGSGGYLLVTTERARQANITLMGLTPALETRWTRAMPAGQPSTPQFRVVGIRGGGFIVAGVKDRGLWLSRVAYDGAPVWTEARPPKPPQVETVLNVELLARDDAFFLLYTVFAVEGKEQRQLVRAMRFGA